MSRCTGPVRRLADEEEHHPNCLVAKVHGRPIHKLELTARRLSRSLNAVQVLPTYNRVGAGHVDLHSCLCRCWICQYVENSSLRIHQLRQL